MCPRYRRLGLTSTSTTRTQRVIQVRASATAARQHLAAGAVPGWPRWVCCRLHPGKLPRTGGCLPGGSTPGPLFQRWETLALETLAPLRILRNSGPGGRPLVRSGRGQQQFVKLRVAGLGETPSSSRRHSLSGRKRQGLGHVVLGGQRPHQVPVPAFRAAGPAGSAAGRPTPRRQARCRQVPVPAAGVALEGAQAQLGELVADLVDPVVRPRRQEAASARTARRRRPTLASTPAAATEDSAR